MAAKTIGREPIDRSRPVWLALIVLTIALGLGSRHYRAALPPFVAAYAGDTLWATCAFFLGGLLAPRAKTGQVAASALLFAYLIEISQLYHAPGIDAIRRTTPGALILGFGFLWSDIVCYTAGVVIGILVELLLGRYTDQRAPRTSS